MTIIGASQVSAHRPLEVTRMAVHDACGREMAGALREYRMWAARNRRRTSGVDAPTLHAGKNNHDCHVATRTLTATAGLGRRTREVASKTKIAELQRTPVRLRTMRWLLLTQQGEARAQAADAEAMFTEEMEQRHKER